VESLAVSQFDGAYRGRRVLLTGHTGFKGSWLALWFTELGAEVTGLALAPPTSPNHWDLLGLDIAEHRMDIRNAPAVAQLVARAQPEIIFHLAAQSLVRKSYRDPLDTWSTNVMGTANLLDACRRVPSVRAIVVVTSDKCYENHEQERGYQEPDRLGGHDPYSASKAATELVAASFRKAYFATPETPLLATARAGNVVGGGDWSEDRLIPDLVRAAAQGRSLEIRSPDAIRPWQHVLESLTGYLLLGQKLLAGDRDGEGAWNFGSGSDDKRTVADVLTQMRTFWPGLTWQLSSGPQPHETRLLHLDSSKARAKLGWEPVWSLETTLRATAEWYQGFLATRHAESRSQLRQYVADARAAGCEWSPG
jgi:CDP-glucose 4,6-dehydratase